MALSRQTRSATATPGLEIEHEREGFIDRALFERGEATGELPETLHVNGAQLFDQDARGLVSEPDLRAKRRGSGAARGGSHDRGRKTE